MTDSGVSGGFPRHSVDTLPVLDASADSIDHDKVALHISQARARGRYTGPDDPTEYLLHRKGIVLVDGEPRPTLAGIMCFGRDPQFIFPYAVVDIGHYRGNDSISFEVIHLEKNIGGTIFDQMRRVEEYLWRNTHHGMVLAERNLERVEVHEYPRAVIRELVVNLLAHRDYTIVGSAARVSLFRNRIEWISPGGLPPGVTVDNLLDSQNARNAGMLRMLYEAGLVEAYGQGLDTVVNVLKEEGMLSPAFRDVGTAFIVTVFGRTMDREADTGITMDLTPSQRKLVLLLQARGDLSPREIREQLPDRTPRSIQRDIKSLIEAGLIEPIGESVAVQYRLRPQKEPGGS
jgi:ATP-dependent DNA helicase RecG